MTSGVSQIPGYVGPPNASAIVLFEDGAFPVVTSGGSVLAAAGAVDGGRIFAIGHPDYLRAELGNLDTETLILNAVAWLGAAGEGIVVGVDASLVELQQALADGGLTVEVRGPDDLAGLDVYVPDAPALDEVGVESLRGFLSGGGGVLMAAEAMTTGAWGLAANAVLFDAGMIAVQQTVGGVDPVSSQPPDAALNSATAFGQLARASSTPRCSTRLQRSGPSVRAARSR